jgi:hypothetical protein
MISCIPLCGSFLNGAVIPGVFNNNQSFGEAFLVGLILCVVSFLMVIGIACLDRKMEKRDAEKLEEFSA